MSSPLFPETYREPVNPNPIITVSTDGACLRNPGGPSGWSWYASDNCWQAGGMKVGTNQQAELLAVLNLLRNIPLDVKLKLMVDSQYTINSCTKWIRAWKARGWKKADGNPVMNLELMKALDEAMRARTAPFTMEWVRGHNGDVMNENADYHCGEAARAISKNLPVDVGPGWGIGPDGTITYPPRKKP